MNQEILDVQAVFRIGRGTRGQIANIYWIRKQGNVRKTPTSASLSTLKLFTVEITKTVENSTRDGNTRPITCFLRDLYAGQETTVRTEHETMDWIQIGKIVCQGCI